MPADCAPAEESIRQFLVHDGHTQCIETIAAVEVTPLDQRDLKRSKVAVVDDIEGELHVLAPVGRVPLRSESPTLCAAHRQCAREADGGNAGCARNPLAHRRELWVR